MWIYCSTVNSNICYSNFCLSIQRKQSQQFKVPLYYYFLGFQTLLEIKSSTAAPAFLSYGASRQSQFLFNKSSKAQHWHVQEHWKVRWEREGENAAGQRSRCHSRCAGAISTPAGSQPWAAAARRASPGAPQSAVPSCPAAAHAARAAWESPAGVLSSGESCRLSPGF